MSGKSVGELKQELSVLEKRFQLLEGDRKAYYETSQWQIRSNKGTVSELRKDNKKLREKLGKLRKEAHSAPTVEADSASHSRELHTRRSRVNQLKFKMKEKSEDLRKLQDQLRELNMQAQTTNNEDTPHVRHIRQLENRLDKAMIKFNETISIRKTYEGIVKKLGEERLTFDARISALEGELRGKDREYKELLDMSRDAKHARDVALSELSKYEELVEQEKHQKEREVAKWRADVQTRIEANEKAERRAKARAAETHEDDNTTAALLAGAGKKGVVGNSAGQAAADEADNERKITSYEEAFRKIKDATGVSDVNEVIQKFLTQEDTHHSLMTLKEEAQQRIDSLTLEKGELRTQAETLKYSGSGSQGNRRVVEEFESHLLEATARMQRLRGRHERVAKTLISVKAGVDHLSDKLGHVALDLPPVDMSDDTVVDVLFQSEQRVVKVLEDMEAAGVDPDTAAPSADTVSLEAAAAAAPPSSIRVPLGPEFSDDESDESDSEDDAILDRSKMKELSMTVLERENRRGKGKSEYSGVRGMAKRSMD